MTTECCPSSSLNRDGIITRPFSSMACWYDPINTSSAPIHHNAPLCPTMTIFLFYKDPAIPSFCGQRNRNNCCPSRRTQRWAGCPKSGQGTRKHSGKIYSHAGKMAISGASVWRSQYCMAVCAHAGHTHKAGAPGSCP